MADLFFVSAACAGLAARGGGKATLIFLACAGAGYLFIRHTTFNGLNPHYLGLFAFGALGAQIAFSAKPEVRRLRDRLPCGPLLLFMTMLLIGLIYRYTWAFALQRLVFFDLLVGVSATLLLIMAARPQPTWVRKFLSLKPLAFLGTFSYSIYLIHVPVQQLFWQYALRPLHLSSWTTFCLLVLTGTPFILGVAYLFFLACERPFMNSAVKKSAVKKQD